MLKMQVVLQRRCKRRPSGMSVRFAPSARMDTRLVGDVGVAQAIYWFTKNGYTVSIPISEGVRYDLLVDLVGVISRVQCKRSETASRYAVPIISLRTCGGNRSGVGKIKRISKFECDFVWCSYGVSGWLIPTELIHNQATVSLGDKYETYKVL